MARLPDYGIDAPIVVRNNALFGVLAIGAGAVAFITLRISRPALALDIFVRAGITGAILLALAGYMLWSSKFGKFRVLETLIAGIAWRGDEHVLDIGCGRGLVLIACAKRLLRGTAVGLDLWSTTDLSGNNAEATRANCRAEGVEHNISLETGDARRMPFPDASFDVVVSMTALHNIKEKSGRAAALAEAVRVLRPGGKLAIFDIFRAGEYRKWLSENGLEAITFSRLILLWLVPGHIVTARKPIAVQHDAASRVT